VTINEMPEAFIKMSTYKTILPIITLMTISAFPSLAQTISQQDSAVKKTSPLPAKKGQKFLDQEMLKMEMPGRNNEPHYIMAMAYLQSIAIFTKAVGDQAAGDNQLSSDFARAAVSEINRSLDKAEEHHQDHLKTMSADKRAKLAIMMKAMDLQRSGLNDAVSTLGKDVQKYTLDAQQIATDCAVILKHLDELTKMRGED
jgi:hypothetical protein